MKFTLLFYTEGWETGRTVELTHIPTPGSLVWVGGRRREEDGFMFYVDNVMYPERGMEREEVIYLYVRPYNGYTEYAPKTEADRLAEKLGEINDGIAVLREVSESIASAGESLKAEISALREAVDKKKSYDFNFSEQILQLVDSIEDVQQAGVEKLDDVAVLIEQIKDQL